MSNMLSPAGGTVRASPAPLDSRGAPGAEALPHAEVAIAAAHKHGRMAPRMTRPTIEAMNAAVGPISPPWRKDNRRQETGNRKQETGNGGWSEERILPNAYLSLEPRSSDCFACCLG